METGVIIKSSSFHTNPYWVVKCDAPNLVGSRNNELPINPLTEPNPFVVSFGKTFDRPIEGMKVEFEITKHGDNPKLMYYASIKSK
jgi:hypothetical protein